MCVPKHALATLAGINEREPAAIWASRMSADHCPNVPDRPRRDTVGGGFPVAAHCIDYRTGRPEIAALFPKRGSGGRAGLVR